MRPVIDIDEIFCVDRTNPVAERSLPWEETCDGITVVVEPKPHWAEDLRAFRLEAREYCRYADWLHHGARARFFGHADLCGDEVMLRARAMVAREIAEGLWDCSHGDAVRRCKAWLHARAWIKCQFHPASRPAFWRWDRVRNHRPPVLLESSRCASRLARQGICDGYPAAGPWQRPSPLPCADLGLIRVLGIQPQRGRLTRACRPRRSGA